MQITRRPWILASSVALVGAGMIAVNPPAPSRPDVHVRPVTLTAVDDPLTALDDVLQAASANATALNDEFAAARGSLWHWIARYQIPSAAVDGALFAQFFEDHETPTNRTAWAPLNLARYLLEKREQLDPDWRHPDGRRLRRRLEDSGCQFIRDLEHRR